MAVIVEKMGDLLREDVRHVNHCCSENTGTVVYADPSTTARIEAKLAQHVHRGFHRLARG